MDVRAGDPPASRAMGHPVGAAPRPTAELPVVGAQRNDTDRRVGPGLGGHAALELGTLHVLSFLTRNERRLRGDHAGST